MQYTKFFDILLNETNYLPILLPSNHVSSLNIFAYLKYFMEFCWKLVLRSSKLWKLYLFYDLIYFLCFYISM